MSIFLRSIFVLTAVCAVVARSEDSAIQPWPLPPNDTFLAVIPPPPKPGDPRDISDLDYTLAVQAAATPEQIAHAVKTAGLNVFTFSEAIGPRFTAENYPRTEAFFKRLEVTAKGPTNYIKDTYQRLRPIDGHKGVVKLNAPYEAGFSCPSGHSTRSWLFALVLGQLDPAARFACIRAAAQVGEDRVVAGLHYETDVIASRALAQQIYSDLMKEPLFVKDLDALKAAEWQNAVSAAKRGQAVGFAIESPRLCAYPTTR